MAEPGDLVIDTQKGPDGELILNNKDVPVGDTGVIPRVMGSSEDDLLNVVKVAVDENVLISFRARAFAAIDLLKRNLAWPKMGAYPVKGTTEIDIKYLGYPKDRVLPDGVTVDPRYDTGGLGTTGIVEPPRALQGKTKAELDAAILAYMDDSMARLFPELDKASPEFDQDRFNAVRDRLKTRAQEWPKNLNKVSDWEAGDGVPVTFGYKKQAYLASSRTRLRANVKCV